MGHLQNNKKTNKIGNSININNLELETMITKYVKEHILDSIKKQCTSYNAYFYNNDIVCIKRDCYNIYIKPLIAIMNGNRLISVSIDKKICNIQVDKWLDIYWNIQSEYHKSLYASQIKKFHIEKDEDSILLSSANIYDDLNFDGTLYKFSQGPKQNDIDNIVRSFLNELNNKIDIFLNKYNTQELMREYIESRHLNDSVYLISCIVNDDIQNTLDKAIQARVDLKPVQYVFYRDINAFLSFDRKISKMLDKVIYYCIVHLYKEDETIDIQEEIQEIEYTIASKRSEIFFGKIKHEFDEMCKIQDMHNYIDEDNDVQRYQHIWFKRVGIFVFIFFVYQDLERFEEEGVLYHYVWCTVKLYEIDNILHDILGLDIKKLSQEFYRHNKHKTTCRDPELIYRVGNINNELFTLFYCNTAKVYSTNNRTIDGMHDMSNIKLTTNCDYMKYQEDDAIQCIVHKKYQNSTLDQILAILTLIAIKDYDLAIKRIQSLIDDKEDIIVPGFEEYGDLSERLIKYCYDRMSDNK